MVGASHNATMFIKLLYKHLVAMVAIVKCFPDVCMDGYTTRDMDTGWYCNVTFVTFIVEYQTYQLIITRCSNIYFFQ